MLERVVRHRLARRAQPKWWGVCATPSEGQVRTRGAAEAAMTACKGLGMDAPVVEDACLIPRGCLWMRSPLTAKRSPPTNEIAAELRCSEMACASYLQACETAARPATTASIGSSTAEMKRSPRPQSRANDRFGSRSNQAADLEVRPPCRLCIIPLLEGGC